MQQKLGLVDGPLKTKGMMVLNEEALVFKGEG
jgi:hypothetical protein